MDRYLGIPTPKPAKKYSRYVTDHKKVERDIRLFDLKSKKRNKTAKDYEWLRNHVGQDIHNRKLLQRKKSKYVYKNPFTKKTMRFASKAEYECYKTTCEDSKKIDNQNINNAERSGDNIQNNNLDCITFDRGWTGPHLYFGNMGIGDSDSKGFGINLLSAYWEMIQAKADYKYGGAKLGAVRAEANSSLSSSNWLDLGLMFSCVNGQVYARIPIGNHKHIKITAEGYAAAYGIECKVTPKKFKIGFANFFGGAISLEKED